MYAHTTTHTELRDRTGDIKEYYEMQLYTHTHTTPTHPHTHTHTHTHREREIRDWAGRSKEIQLYEHTHACPEKERNKGGSKGMP